MSIDRVECYKIARQLDKDMFSSMSGWIRYMTLQIILASSLNKLKNAKRIKMTRKKRAKRMIRELAIII